MYNPGLSFLNNINESYTRKPKSKIVVMDELGNESNGIIYTGELHLVTYPKVEHSTTQFIGGFPAKTCEFEIYSRDENAPIVLYGKEVKVYRGLEFDGTVTWIPMGIFKAADADIKTNINKRSISFKGTDRTRLFERKYTEPDGFTVSKTLLWLVNQICSRNGVAFNGSIPLNRMTVHSLPNVEDGTTDRQMIAYIAEINGCIAMIDRTGALIFKKPSNIGITIPKERYKTFSYENVYGPINSIYFGHVDYDDTIHYPENLPDNTEEVKWVIKDNPIIDNDRAWWLDPNRVPSQILNRAMRPFEITELIDDYLFDIGDIFTVEDKFSRNIEVTVLSISETSRIKSTMKAEYPAENEADRNLSGSIKESVNSVKLKVDHINNEITAIAESVDGCYTSINQNAESIASTAAKVDEQDDRIAENTALINQTANSIYAEVNTKCTLQDAQDAANEAEENAKAYIDIKSSEITLAVNTNLKAKNLLNDAECFETRSIYAYQCSASLNSDNGYGFKDDTSVPSGRKGIVGLTSAGNSIYFGVYVRGEYITDNSCKKILDSIDMIKPDTTYTLSFWAKTIGSRNLSKTHLIQSNLEINEIESSDFSTSNTWKKFIFKFTTGSGQINQFNIRFIIDNGKESLVEILYFSSIQLEEGAVATDWRRGLKDDERAAEAKLALYVKMDEDGKLVSNLDMTANQIKITSDDFSLENGEITARKGTIGGWDIKSDGLYIHRAANDRDLGYSILSSNTVADDYTYFAFGTPLISGASADDLSASSLNYDDAEILAAHRGSSGSPYLRIKGVYNTAGINSVYSEIGINYINLYTNDSCELSLSTGTISSPSPSIYSCEDKLTLNLNDSKYKLEKKEWQYTWNDNIAVTSDNRAIFTSPHGTVISANGGENALYLEGKNIFLCTIGENQSIHCYGKVIFHNGYSVA